MRLTKSGVKILTPSAPFNFDATFHKPAHFPSGDNYWEPGLRWQTWLWKREFLGLKFINKGKVEKPKVELEIYSTSKVSEKIVKSLIKEVRYKYNFDLDLRDFYNRFKEDKVLYPIIERWKGSRPGHQGSLYEYLMIGIVLQNAPVKRSVNMLQALFENYGSFLEYDGKGLWCFWNPGKLREISEKDLRILKVGYRAKSIKKIDDFFSTGGIDEFELRNKNLDEQREELLEIYGVGPATCGYILFDVFHHWDYLEHISPWEQKIYSKLFFNKNPENPVPVEELLAYFEKYIPYRQLAVHYIWDDLWWKRKNKDIPWLEELIRL